MKNIAIVTGASSGIGKEIFKRIEVFGPFDEIWVVARNLDKLNALKNETNTAVKPLALDLSNSESYDEFSRVLEEEKPSVSLLVNCSGFGKFAATTDYPLSEDLNMVDLNCKGVMATCELTLPYMPDGARIINIASVAAFQPIPYINVYAASKAFVLSFSRALNQELKQRKISVTAVCPFWTKTAFFDRAVIGKDAVVKKYVAMYKPEDIAKRAIRDAKRRKDVSKFGFIARFQAGLCKILPHSLVMKVWKNQQKLK